MERLAQNTAAWIVVGPLIDSGTGRLVLDTRFELELDEIDAALVVGVTRTAITLGDVDHSFEHIGGGYYKLHLAAADTATEGVLAVSLIDEDVMLPVHKEFIVGDDPAVVCKDILEGDAFLIAGETGYTMQVKRKGTETVLVEKLLNDVVGTPITSASGFIGQQVEVPA
jgi:hypothetical protein